MANITFVGLGLGDRRHRTFAAQDAIDRAGFVFVRGMGDPALADLEGLPNVRDLFGLTGVSDSGTPQWQRAAELICDEATNGDVVVAVQGHPRVGEPAVFVTEAEARKRGLSVAFVDGVSSIELLATAVGVDVIRDNIQIVNGMHLRDAMEAAPFSGGLLPISPRQPVFLTFLFGTDAPARTSEALQRLYPADHPVSLVFRAGSDDERREETTILGLAAVPPNFELSAYIPSIPEPEATRSPETLQHIVARLRRPDGCPWDRKQTNATLAQSLVDEVYEIVDAIDTNDSENLAEELGDLLMLIMMHAQIAEEEGHFTLEDVYQEITTKIVRRHPHVFGGTSAENAGDVVALWQEVKRQEKAAKPVRTEKAVDGQPHSMPALERAKRVLPDHPLDESITDTASDAGTNLLHAVARVISAGEDPDTVLKNALINHVLSAHGAVKKTREESGS